MTTTTKQHFHKHTIDGRDVVFSYFGMLGGNILRYNTETARRVNDFCKELEVKRDYTRFTAFESKNDSMIVGQSLRLFSFCEHHLLPFFGIANIGYIPDSQIFGLSKLQRIVDKFASKPTLQEDLTEEICDFINNLIKPKGVIVQLKAIHSCVVARGTESTNAQFITTSLKGVFKTDAVVRNEFFHSLESNHMLKLL